MRTKSWIAVVTVVGLLAPNVTLGSSRDCSIIYFAGGSTEPDDRDRITGLGYALTYTSNPTDLDIDNLTNFSVVIIYGTGPNVLGAYQNDLASFTAAGGSLFIHQPNTVGVIDYAPPNLGATIAEIYWCYGNYVAYITDPTHAITMNMTDGDLAGDFDWVQTLGSGYTVLARNTSCDSPAVAAGTHGDGKVVFDTGNFGSPYAAGSDAFVSQLLDYLCDTGGTIATAPTTWGSFKSLYR